MKIIFLGDVVARPGREAVKKAMDKLKTKYQPDLIIANAENIAHGKGLTQNTLQELKKSGVDFFTSGNHVWKKEGKLLLENPKMSLIRPANYPEGVIGKGYQILNVLTQRVAIINLIGRTFFRHHYDCPFRAADHILAQLESEKPNGIFVDFHCEATSEARAMGFYLDGRVSAVIGSHTHVQTADDQILSGQTAYLTDAGMCGKLNSVLGKNTNQVIDGFLKQDSVESDWDNDWEQAQIQGVLVEITRNLHAKKIIRINHIIKK
ncbi:MAG: TIGR00282 family metallophosphoesterase [Candidatus Moranbacteria bacterium]|nr:TIGR00282 family metallophosphoesterase [Candidatus Moranbacteria bacterium]